MHSKTELDAIDAAMSALPSAMKRLESAATPQSRRFSAGHDGNLNQSFEMSDIMAAHDINPCNHDVTGHDKKHYVQVDHIDEMLHAQANKIVKKLAKRVEREKLAQMEKDARDVHETATIAKQTLEQLAEVETKGSIKDLYSQYDVNRTGRITYADFSAALNKASAGVNGVEVQNLLAKIDPYHTGTILYSDVADKLKAVISEEKPVSSKTTSPVVAASS